MKGGKSDVSEAKDTSARSDLSRFRWYFEGLDAQCCQGAIQGGFSMSPCNVKNSNGQVWFAFAVLQWVECEQALFDRATNKGRNGFMEISSYIALTIFAWI